MAYFGLSLLALGTVTELEVQSSSFSQLTFIHELFFSFSRLLPDIVSIERKLYSSK